MGVLICFNRINYKKTLPLVYCVLIKITTFDCRVRPDFTQKTAGFFFAKRGDMWRFHRDHDLKQLDSGFAMICWFPSHLTIGKP